MKFYPRLFLVVCALLSVTLSAHAQEETKETRKQKRNKWRDEYTLPTWGIKTNLLYDATTTINLGFEFRVGRKTSIDIPVNYNPWQFNGGETKIKHILVQPEFRWWPNGTFNGNFFGLHGHYAFYNVGGLPNGPFTKYMRDHRFQGWLAGAGVSWGYRWNFNHHWGLEVTLGIGYAYLDYDKYQCQTCGDLLGPETKHYFGPTKAGVTLIFGLGAKKKEAPVPVIPPAVAYVAPPAIAVEQPVIIETEPIVVPVVPVAPVVVPVAVYTPAIVASYIAPYVEPVKSRSESGKAYLEFYVGRSELLSYYRNNSSELQKIYDLVDEINSNPNATITRVSITGYASPEGSYNGNVALSESRAQAVREHVASVCDIEPWIISSRGGGEDWASLPELVRRSNIAGKGYVLGVLNGRDSYNVKERKMMSMMAGQPYRQIRAQIYPKLRRTDYVIEYTIAPINIERGKAMLKSRPEELSLNEMFFVASTCTPGSDEYNEVFETAARVYPDSDIANINAAAAALGRNEMGSASVYLGRVANHSEAWWNNMGVLAWLKGDKIRAAEYFRRGGRVSVDNSTELEKHLKTTENK